VQIQSRNANLNTPKVYFLPQESGPSEEPVRVVLTHRRTRQFNCVDKSAPPHNFRSCKERVVAINRPIAPRSSFHRMQGEGTDSETKHRHTSALLKIIKHIFRDRSTVPHQLSNSQAAGALWRLKFIGKLKNLLNNGNLRGDCGEFVASVWSQIKELIR
jgi:hypothetical protein